MKRHFRLLSALAVLALFSLPALADPPSDKGQGKGQSAAQQGQSAEHGPPAQQGQNDLNHGQVVSECNHRANDRNMKGQDRKQWVEWCEERGSHYKYDDRRWSAERNCYQRADAKSLSGDKRRHFLNECLGSQHYDDSKYNTKYEPRGKDVLGKSKD
jgi:hypothetical protein